MCLFNCKQPEDRNGSSWCFVCPTVPGAIDKTSREGVEWQTIPHSFLGHQCDDGVTLPDNRLSSYGLLHSCKSFGSQLLKRNTFRVKSP